MAQGVACLCQHMTAAPVGYTRTSHMAASSPISPDLCLPLLPASVAFLCLCCHPSSRVRDITALFNLPKKVAAGRGAAAGELEQQLQKAQQLAKQEQQRAQQLEERLQVSQQDSSCLPA